MNRYRYYCSTCGSSLLVSEVLVDPVRVRAACGPVCPTCNANLSYRVEWRSINSHGCTPPERARCVKAAQATPSLPVSFRRASEIQTGASLTFGDEALDRFVEGPHLGDVLFMYGSWQCLAVSELLCVRAQLEPNKGGLGSRAVFIDGGNTFDPYLIAEYAGRFSLDRDAALDSILVSRAFTCHQLTSLITRTLWQAVRERGARLAVVSDMIDLYREPDVQRPHTLNLFKTALNSLATTTKMERAIAVATHTGEELHASDPFLAAAKRRVDIVARFEERTHSTRILLEKHPTRSGESFVLKQPTPRLLEAFLEVEPDG